MYNEDQNDQRQGEQCTLAPTVEITQIRAHTAAIEPNSTCKKAVSSALSSEYGI